MDGYNATAVSESCDNTTHNVLMDGFPHSCMSLQFGIQYLSLFPNSPAPTSGSVLVQTRGLPCSEPFHVMVSAVCPQSCPRKHKCHLESSVITAIEENSCWFHCSCLSSLIVQQVDIRLVTLQQDTFICETLWLDDIFWLLLLLIMLPTHQDHVIYDQKYYGAIIRLLYTYGCVDNVHIISKKTY